MKISAPYRRMLSVCAVAAMLAGCGGPQPPIGAPRAMQQGRASEHQADRDGAWMLPEAKSTKELLYISDQSTNHVYVYNYNTRRLLGRLRGFYQPSGQCVDSRGDVWITDSAGEAVVEYAHGALRYTKRIRTIGLANSCSVDPTTGDLAVSNIRTPRGESKIEVFYLMGNRKVYSSDACQEIVQVGYDNQGNLYVSATSQESSSYVCELPHGSSQLVTVSISKTIVRPGGVMWDGKYITFTDTLYAFDYTAIYQAQPESSGLEIVGQTDFNGCRGGLTSITQPFIVGSKNTPSNNQQGNAVVGTNMLCGFSGTGYEFSYWAYPAGGDPKYTLFDAPIDPAGQSVSIGT